MIDKNDPRLTDFVLGELNSAQSAEIQDAIADSAELKTAVEEIRQTVSLLGAAYQAEEPLSLLDEQKAELALTQGEKNGLELATKAMKKSSGRPWLPIALAAGLMGVLVGAAIYFNNPPLSQEVAKRIQEVGKMDRSQMEAFRTKSSDESTESVELEKLVTEYNQSIDDGDYDQAEILAEKADAIAPGSEIAVLMNEKSQAVSRLSRMKSVQDAKESGYWSAFGKSDSIATSTEPSADPNSNLEMKRELGADSSGDMSESIAGQRGSKDIGGESARLAGKKQEEYGFAGRGGQPGNDAGGGLQMGGGAGGGSGFGGAVSDQQRQQQAGEDKFFDSGVTGGINVQPDDQFGEGQQGRGIELRGGMDAIKDLDLKIDSASALDQNTGGSTIVEKLSENGQQPAPMQARQMRIANADILPEIADNARPTPALQGMDEDFGDESDASDSADGKFVQDGQAAEGNRRRQKFEGIRLSEREAMPAKPQQGESASRQPISPQRFRRGSGSQSGEVMEEAAKNNLSGNADEMKNALKQATPRFAAPAPAEQKALNELGLRVVTQFESQTKTRDVPVQRMRSETRKRKVPMKDGTVEEQEYTVQVPFTENATQDFTVQVPVVALDIEAEDSRKLVENLARRIDPDSAREFGLAELLDSAKQLEDSTSRGAQGEDRDLKLAVKLRELSAPLGEQKKSGLSAAPALAKLNQELQKRNAKIRQTRTWKRVKAIPNTTRLMVGDKDELRAPRSARPNVRCHRNESRVDAMYVDPPEDSSKERPE